MGYGGRYTRRLDSAVRQNVLDGIRSLSNDVRAELGKEFGADGIELSAHRLCAPDHLPYQGKQYSNEEFAQIQAKLKRPFFMWNCKHSLHPIMLGISEPAYSEEELESYKHNSEELIEIDGVKKTRYEWSQEQRRVETAIRRQKDVGVAAQASGDNVLRREAQTNINALTEYYQKISEKSGLATDFSRTRVEGFKEMGKRELQKAAGSGTISSESELGKFKQTLSGDDRVDKEYYSELKTKFSHGSDEAKSTFNQYVTGSTVADSDYISTPCFDPKTKKIYMNYAADAKNVRGSGVTYFHEHAHLIDDARGYVSHDRTFLNLLDKDALNYRQQYGKTHSLKTMDKVDAAISAGLGSMRKHSGVSDILGGITRGNISGIAGHSATYWNDDSICEEAFAHMFECQFDGVRYKEMQKYFPESLRYFEENML